MQEKLLEDLGLTKGEVKVYLTLLKLGETTTGKIIEAAQISSGKIYEILDKLMHKGLVSYVTKEKTKYFLASSPKRILDYVNEKEQELNQKKQDLTKELPSLLALQQFGRAKYETKLYSGFKGIQTAIFEALEELKSGEVLAMGIRSSKDNTYNLLWQRWHLERIRRKIRCRAVFSDSETEYYHNFKKMKYTSVKVLKEITPSAIDIIGEKVLIFTYGDNPTCLSINNPEIAKSFTSFFETVWKSAK